MKRTSLFTRSLIITLCLLIGLVVPVLAGSTTKTLSTNYVVVNLSTTANASVTALYYKDDGTPWDADAANESFSVPMNYGQTQVRQYFDTTMSAGKGSAVLSSTEPLAAVVQIWARSPQVPTAGSYLGYNSGANKFYVPLAFRNRSTASGNTNTQIMIQNIMNEAISAAVDFIPLPGSGFSAYTKNFASIPAYTTQYYDVADESATNLPNGWIGSAVVTAQTGKQVAVVFNIFVGDHGMNTLNAFPAEIAGATWAVPQFTSKLANGYSTSINVQNISGSEIAINGVTLACKVKPGGSPATQTFYNTAVIPNNASFSFNPYGNAAYPNNWEGACTLTAPGDVVTFVQQRQPALVGNNNHASFEAFNTSSTNSKIVAPIVYKRLANGYAASPIIQNISTTSTAYVTLTYTRAAENSVGDAVYTKNVTILPGEQLNENLRLTAHPQNLDGGKTMPDGWQGSLVVTTQAAHTAVPIIAFVAWTNWTNSFAGDNWLSSQAITLSEP